MKNIAILIGLCLVSTFLFNTSNTLANETSKFCGKVIAVSSAADHDSDWVSSITLIDQKGLDIDETLYNDKFLNLRDPNALKKIEETISLKFIDYTYFWEEVIKSIAKENIFVCLENYQQNIWRDRQYAHQVQTIRLWKDFEFVGVYKLFESR